MSYEGLKSAQALYQEWIDGKDLAPLTLAAKMQMVETLRRPPVCDEAGNVIGYGPPLISASDAVAILQTQEDSDANS